MDNEMLRMAMSNQRIDMVYENKSNICGYLIKDIYARPCVIRKVCAKRARKLRRLGEPVVWDTNLNSHVWEMRIDLPSHVRYAVRRSLNYTFYDYEMPSSFLDRFRIEGTQTARLN